MESRSLIEGRLNFPYGVCWSTTTEELLVADTSNHCVQTFDANGRFVRIIGKSLQKNDDDETVINNSTTPFQSPFDVCTQQPHLPSVIFVADSKHQRISIWDPSGQQQIDELHTTGYPRGVCTDLLGRLHISTVSPSRVWIYDVKMMKMLQCLGEGEGSGSRDGASAIDRSGNVGEFASPTGLCVDEWNRLWVCDSSNQRVQMFEIR